MIFLKFTEKYKWNGSHWKAMQTVIPFTHVHKAYERVITTVVIVLYFSESFNHLYSILLL